MPNKTSAEKALRQTKTRTERNLKVKKQIKWVEKQIAKALGEKKKDEAMKLVKDLQQIVDKAIKKHVLHANTGNRKKSRTIKAIKKA